MKQASVPESETDLKQTSEVDVSIVIVNWNTRSSLLQCLASVRQATTGVAREVIVVDNGSADGSSDAVLESFPEVKLIANRHNAGFARANNQAFRHCHGRYTLLLNPDTAVNVTALRGLVDFMDSRADAGAAGVRLQSHEGRPQNSYDNFPAFLTELLSKHLLRFLFPGRFPSKRRVPDGPIEVDIIIGACLMVRTSVLRRLGGFDENYFLFVEETDLCKRIWDAGWKIFHLPDLSIIHGSHLSKEQAPALSHLESLRSTYYFFSKHRGKLVATTFRVLKASKLIFTGLPLSIIANLFTLGRVPRHVRRLRIRSLLTAWHVLGCPRTWGLLWSSPVKGYQRHCSTKLFRRCRRIVPDRANTELRRLLDDPPKALADGGALEVEVVEERRSRGVYKVAVHEPAPADIVASLPGSQSLVDGFSLFLILYRPSGWLARLGSLRMPPRGMAEFRRALEGIDVGLFPTAVAGAGYDTTLGLERFSFVAFFLHAEIELTELPVELLAASDEEDGRLKQRNKSSNACSPSLFQS